jgi:hypothetical protein
VLWEIMCNDISMIKIKMRDFDTTDSNFS